MNHVDQGKIAVVDSSVAITRLGFGCARLFGGSERRSSARLIEAALRAGIRHFDTAPSYAFEQSEQVLGDVLRGEKGITITTKFGLSYDANGRSRAMGLYRRALRPMLAHAPALKAGLMKVIRPVPAGDMQSHAHEKSVRKIAREEVLRSLEGSLARLQRDRVDILLLHQPDSIVVDDALGEVLLECRSAGTVGAFGRAWDRAVSEVPPFGQVVQCRFDGSGQPAAGDPHTFIFHGLLRHAASALERTGGRLTPAQRIASVLVSNPSAAVIFSASHPRQIAQITAGIAAC